jgi:tRNA threonylcarbamoyladenosine biosynthesis protein TsaB
MRILAIETSGRDATLAALEGFAEGNDKGNSRLVREAAIVGPERTAQFLAPRLKELLAAVGWQPSQIELVAVAVGPGSFTGLRIGVTTAKTLAYAVGAQVVGVNTLAAIAQQAPATSTPLWCVMDAQRHELFAAKFDALQGMTTDMQILSQPAWTKLLEPGNRVSGPGLHRLRVELPTDVQSIDQSLWQPLASTVGQLAWRDFQAGRRDDLWKLVPQYYRQSAAEEKRGLQAP